MLVAVYPGNEILIHKDYACVYNQGQLILALTKNPQEEILLDRDLPGHLRLVDLIEVIARKFPDAQVSVIEKELDAVPESTPVPNNVSNNDLKLSKLIIAPVIVFLIYILWSFSLGSNQYEYLISFGVIATLLICAVVFLSTSGGVSCKKK